MQFTEIILLPPLISAISQYLRFNLGEIDDGVRVFFDEILFIYKAFIQSPVSQTLYKIKQGTVSLLTVASLFSASTLPKDLSLLTFSQGHITGSSHEVCFCSQTQSPPPNNTHLLDLHLVPHKTPSTYVAQLLTSLSQCLFFGLSLLLFQLSYSEKELNSS